MTAKSKKAKAIEQHELEFYKRKYMENRTSVYVNAVQRMPTTFRDFSYSHISPGQVITIPDEQPSDVHTLRELPEDRGIYGILHPYTDQDYYQGRSVLSNVYDQNAWKQREQNGDAPQTIMESEWREQYRKPKPIQWEMMKILENKCWRCQHWTFSTIYYDILHCELNGGNTYHYGSSEFNKKIAWASITSTHIVQHGDTIYFNDMRSMEENYPINECPCFSETQEYHDWKEQQAFLKVNQSPMLL